MQSIDDGLAFYRRAAFRPGVAVAIAEANATFTYGATSFEVDFNAATRRPLEELCQGLRDGLPMAGLAERIGPFAPYAAELLDALDRYGFLTDVEAAAGPGYVTGPTLWRQVQAMTERFRAHSTPPFSTALQQGRLRREHLIAYAAEYYHVVRAGPQILAAALTHAHDAPVRTILEDFLTSEVGHDRLLAASLLAVGLDPAEVAARGPLPETFMLLAALQVLADQEPLSFAAAAFLVEEESPVFHSALVDACHALGLPEGFWRPIVGHSGINSDGDHGGISRRLLAHVETVSEEARIVVLRQVATILEAMLGLERALVAGEPLRP